MADISNIDSFIYAALGREGTPEEIAAVTKLEADLREASDVVIKLFQENKYTAKEYGVALTVNCNYLIFSVVVDIDCTLSESAVLELLPILSVKANKLVDEAYLASQNQIVSIQEKAVKDLLSLLKIPTQEEIPSLSSAFSSLAGGDKNSKLN